MNKLAFTTCIYSNLKDGSSSRKDRYYFSLKNLLNTGAKFVVYCSPDEEQEIRNFTENHTNIILVPFDLKTTKYHSEWESLRNKYNHDNRCMELVHNKINWAADAAKIADADKIYWIDAGLSFFGLFPHRFLRSKEHKNFNKYTDINIFTPEWTERLLKKHSDDEIYCISLSNLLGLWTQPLDSNLYEAGIEDRGKYHIIGGLFGGSVENMKWFQQEYDNKIKKVIEYYKSGRLSSSYVLPVEEVVMNLIIAEHSTKFKQDVFDTWYHEDHEECFNPRKVGTSFYKLFI